MNIKSKPLNTDFVREPKQTRSKATLERLLKAAKDLLAEKGYGEFTLQEVSKRSKVSIGSIYCRFSGKEDLIRQVQLSEVTAMDDEFAVIVNTLRRKQLKLRELVPELTREFGNFLRRHKGVLRPVMEVALIDPVIAKTGSEHFKHSVEDYKRLILECRTEIRQTDAERAVDTCFRVTYASLARYLGLGTIEELNKDTDWDSLLEDLSQVALYYLLGDPKKLQS